MSKHTPQTNAQPTLIEFSSDLPLVISKREIPTEHEEQRAFVCWWRKHFPEHWIMAIPNGGGRGIREAGMLKAEGVSPGVPDLFIPSAAIWIEMKKRKGGRVSKEQKEWAEHLRNHGYIVLTPNGAHDAVEMLKKIIFSS